MADSLILSTVLSTPSTSISLNPVGVFSDWMDCAKFRNAVNMTICSLNYPNVNPSTSVASLTMVEISEGDSLVSVPGLKCWE